MYLKSMRSDELTVLLIEVIDKTNRYSVAAATDERFSDKAYALAKLQADIIEELCERDD